MAEKTIRTWKLTKDKTKPMLDAVKQIYETYGIRISSIKRNGDDFELTFDRDLTEEKAADINAIRQIIQTKFPEHTLTEES